MGSQLVVPECYICKSKAVVQITIQITKTPHNPYAWLERAPLLLYLGYPESGAGDARKAQRLATAILNMDEIGILAKKETCELVASTDCAITASFQNFGGGA
ncbi:uncharacterized protein LY89DRAFT_78982 [Mollisia scopiformis]|uniref:Uncharacterized protein n=1 Tax=Mollisia scopiformis TaxID=149040 RepID=A0A194X7Z6_MOLSC|nr:uncharacterized protein LY89DRAFT_78982 [Mollisia scopiformis]KUJ16285.1 hypothetical protein LY89DRAFT_78982 [Mollisia scopiformis]